MLSKAELDRYARHLILPGVGAAGQRRLKEARVLAVGAGGLGSPLLLYLAAAGVGTLGFVDDERVEVSNLQRQVLHGTPELGEPKVASARRRLEALNPLVALEPRCERLGAENARALVQSYDLVADGSDNFATRYLVNDACVLEGKPLLYGAIAQFEGQVSLLNAGSEGDRGPCYRCLFPTPSAPGAAPNCAEAGVFGALPGVVGGLMAVEAIKHLLGLGSSLKGVLLHYDALQSETRRIRLRRDPACAVCGDEPTITDLRPVADACG